VIEQHGGALDFASPVVPGGGGTEFRFTLPAQPATQPVAETATTP
jgi:signal transduction histidine kinase